MYWKQEYVTISHRNITRHFWVLTYTGKKVFNYFDKTHPVVSVMTGNPPSKQCLPPHTHSPGRGSFIPVVSSMKEVCRWSGVSQGFVLARVQLFVSATFKANVHEHEHEASWVTGPLNSSTMVIPIIHNAQSSCRISYMALCVWFCMARVCESTFAGFAWMSM